MEYSSPSAKRRTASRIFGTVMEAIGNHEYNVRFQNGEIIPCKSSKLTVVLDEEIPPTMQNNSVNDVDEDDVDSDLGSDYVDSEEEDIEDENNFEEEEADDDEEEEEADEHLPESQGSIQDNDPEPDLNTYEERLREARERVKILEGTQVVTRTKTPRCEIVWKVVEKHEVYCPVTPSTHLGLRAEEMEAIIESNDSNDCIAAEIFLRLMFGDKLDNKVTIMNCAVNDFNAQSNRTRPIKLFTKSEFLKGFTLLIGAACYAANGEALWKKTANWDFLTLEPTADFYKFMCDYRFREFRDFLPSLYKSPNLKDSDPWWEFVAAVDEFNLNRLKCLDPSNHLCIDELMSAWRPRTTATGGLPNITHIPRKPKPLGTEFKCVACSQTGCMLYLEIQRGKDGMKNLEHNRELGNTAGCTLRLAQERFVLQFVIWFNVIADIRLILS